MLTLAIPSKGRLKEDCNAWFADAGLVMEQTAGARGYRASFAGLPDIEVMLLSAGEIAASLLAGDIHLGITGEDLLREAAPELEGRMHLVKPLGFGFADVVVAVSQYWIDVSTMADLDDVCAAYAARPSPAPAGGDQICPADARLLRPCRHRRLSHRAQRRRHRRRARRRHRGSDRGHHHHRRDLARQWPEGSG